jgi:hypothetical protein
MRMCNGPTSLSNVIRSCGLPSVEITVPADSIITGGLISHRYPMLESVAAGKVDEVGRRDALR